MNVANNVGRCMMKNLNKVKPDLTSSNTMFKRCRQHAACRTLLVDVGPTGEQAFINSRSILGFYIGWVSQG